MSSFEEESLYEMFDDFLDPESERKPPLLPIASSPKNPFYFDHNHAKYYILQEIVESGTSAEIEVLGSVIKHVRKKLLVDGGEDCSGLKKWLVKSLKKDGYSASLRHTYWPTSLTCPGGEYEYIDIIYESKRGGSKRVIIDLDFKSQFELARPTSEYKDLCDLLPSLFVGDDEKLKNIISILCGEAKNSFRQRGLHVPPWRTPCYMHSKWFSLPQRTTSRREVFATRIGIDVSSKVVARRKYDSLGADQCGLSSQFSAMSTRCG
ncbi:hypothetical protein CDL12_06702 [Handroanthus impetiginosus]|uniref:Uncharacterized protein n=1 Tax=Handroanthus impetiginosus TaxID=429701 RepID=A0A2G9HSW7_9LAMI|nr:hypothetical protein CDL12_06702 [Handroanthus impetiginosus]